VILQHGPVCLHINQLDSFMHRSSPISTHSFFTFVQLYSHRPVIYCNTRPCPLQLIYTAITTPTTPSPSDRDTLQPDLVVQLPHTETYKYPSTIAVRTRSLHFSPEPVPVPEHRYVRLLQTAAFEDFTQCRWAYLRCTNTSHRTLDKS
jgi:hypothetical protein